MIMTGGFGDIRPGEMAEFVGVLEEYMKGIGG
jgi:hypothetical protein